MSLIKFIFNSEKDKNNAICGLSKLTVPKKKLLVQRVIKF